MVNCGYVYVAGSKKGTVCNSFCRSGRSLCFRHNETAVNNKKKYREDNNEKIQEYVSKKLDNDSIKNKKECYVKLPVENLIKIREHHKKIISQYKGYNPLDDEMKMFFKKQIRRSNESIDLITVEIDSRK